MAKALRPSAQAVPLGPARLVHVDERLVVLDKPPGLSLATPRTEPGAAVVRLMDALSLEERELHGLDASDLLLVHRLDVGTSGLVVLARDKETHAALVKAFETRSVGKTYLALAWGHVKGREGVFDAPLGPDTSDRRRMRVDPERGKKAVTRFVVLGMRPHVSLVELHPETGRTHQIRVHLSAVGHPIVGDDLYGGPRHRAVREPGLRRALDPPHAFLHAWKLRLPALRRGASELLLETPLPPAFLNALEVLGIGLM